MINKQSNFHQALWLGIGQFSSFALAFVSAAILSRYFDKTEYGTYRQILYVYITLQTVFTIGLPSVFAYFIPRLSEGQGKTLVNSLTKLLFLLGLIFSIALFSLATPIANLLKNPELATGLRYFSPFPLFTLPTLGIEGIYTALRRTKYIAYFQTASKLLMLLSLTLPVIIFNGTYLTAVLGWGVASLLTFLFAMYLKNRPYTAVRKEVVPNMYKSIFNYSLPLMGASLAGVAINSADQFFISRYFGTSVFAVFANGANSIPLVGMIAGSVKSVILPLLSKADSDGSMIEAVSMYDRAVVKSITLVFPILLFSMFFAGELVVFVYGNQYEGSKSFFRFFMIREFFNVIPYFSVILALGLSNIYFYMHLAGIAFVWALDFIIVNIGLPPEMIVLVSSSFAILSAIFVFLYIFKHTKLNLVSAHLVKSMFTILLHCILTLFIVQMITNRIMVGWDAFYVLIFSGALFYSIIVATGQLLKIDYLVAVKMALKK
jgi:O-antigen/teichoic acid export membrane protein